MQVWRLEEVIKIENIDCLFLRAQLKFKINSFEDCRADHVEALRIRNGNKKHLSDIADSLFEIGNLELKFPNLKGAFSNYIKALKIYLKVDYKIQQQKKVIKSIMPLLNQVSINSKKSFYRLIT
ncbi:MAG: hypothetical protein IPF81_19175 [Bacteroidetes bacterium]|nr:hypothetical protein [Bacteroidota bacterium]